MFGTFRIIKITTKKKLITRKKVHIVSLVKCNDPFDSRLKKIPDIHFSPDELYIGREIYISPKEFY